VNAGACRVLRAGLVAITYALSGVGVAASEASNADPRPGAAPAIAPTVEVTPAAARGSIESLAGYLGAMQVHIELRRRTLEDAARIADAVDSLASLGRAGAYLAGEAALAASFAILRAPLVDVGRRLSQGVVMGLASTVAGAGLLFAGAQALT
jgi:hypothetical protein